MREYTLSDYGFAYRKAKVDLYYASRSCNHLIAQYERNLEENLRALQTRVSQNNAPEVEGQWTVWPKSITLDQDSLDVLIANPTERWSYCVNNSEKKVVTEYRLMENLSIEYHVFATLWLMKVGDKFDAALSASARGNRLRRTAEGKINVLSLGSVQPYANAYKMWRDDALDVIDRELARGEDIATLTTDVKSFYHGIDPSFMLEDKFLAMLNVNLDEQEKALHSLFVGSLGKWAQTTPIKLGLPVGLMASAVIANMVFYELDSVINDTLCPLYYGRYVDDIIIVLKRPNNVYRKSALVSYIARQTNGVLKVSRTKSDIVYRYKPAYLKNSIINFSDEKSKVMLLDARSGPTVVAAIRKEVNSKTSEWRSLPDLPMEPEYYGTTVLGVDDVDGRAALALREVERVSVRRANLAMLLRDVEAYVRALQPQQWDNQRYAFYDAVSKYIIVLPALIEYVRYLPRIVSIMMQCHDYRHIMMLYETIDSLIVEMRKLPCELKTARTDKINGSAELHEYFARDLLISIKMAVVSSYVGKMNAYDRRGWLGLSAALSSRSEYHDISELTKQAREMLMRDLAWMPLKISIMPGISSWYGMRRERRWDSATLKYDAVERLLDGVIVEGCRSLQPLTEVPSGSSVPAGLVYATRPYGIQELYILHRQPFTSDGIDTISKVLLAMRGFRPKDRLPGMCKYDRKYIIEIDPNDGVVDRRRIALTSWSTSESSWHAAACNEMDPDSGRYARLNRLINMVLVSKVKPDYLIMPELSVPAHWFVPIALKRFFAESCG